MKDKILITIVTRNNEVLLKRLLESIEKIDPGWDHDLLVLDAESDRKSHLKFLETVAKRYPVEVVVDDRVEASYNKAWEKNKDYPYYFFLHDDCHVLNENWLRVFVDRMNSGFYEKEIENTHLRHLPIGRVSLGNQFWRGYTSVKGYPVQCQFLKGALELLYPGKVPEIIKLGDCDRLLIKNECLAESGGFRNVSEFAAMKKENSSLYEHLCLVLNKYLTYPDEGMYPKEIYPPGECWNKLTLVTEFLDSVDPLIRGWRSVGLCDSGYLEQIHGFDVPRQQQYVVHYGSPNVREFLGRQFGTDKEEVKRHFNDPAFLMKCDKLIKAYNKTVWDYENVKSLEDRE